MSFDAADRLIEYARWYPDARKEAIEGLRRLQGTITQSLGSKKFDELVAKTRQWAGDEDAWSKSSPDWLAFKNSAETAVRSRLIDPGFGKI